MLIFDPQTGPRALPVEEVREKVRKIFIDAFRADGKPPLNTEPETPQGQLIDSITELLVRQDNELLYLCNMFNPLKAEGIWQEALGKIFFLTRHPAINSTAVVKCVGRAGTFIPRGSLIRSIQDDSEWASVKSINLTEEEYTEVKFTCTKAGAIQAPPNTLTKIITTIAGWDTCTNEAAAVVGNEAESQASFEARRYKSVAKNSRSFLDSVYSRIADLNGVLALCCRHNVNDNIITMDGIPVLAHSVYICVLGGDDNEIAQALHETVGGGCDYTGDIEIGVIDSRDGRTVHPIKFNRPIDKPTAVTVTLRKGDNTPPNADETIKDIIFHNFYGTAESQQFSLQPVERVIMGSTVYASRFIGPLYAAGFEQVISAHIGYKDDSGLADLITVPINIAPSLTRDDISVIWTTGSLQNPDIENGDTNVDEQGQPDGDTNVEGQGQNGGDTNVDNGDTEPPQTGGDTSQEEGDDTNVQGQGQTNGGDTNVDNGDTEVNGDTTVQPDAGEEETAPIALMAAPTTKPKAKTRKR